MVGATDTGAGVVIGGTMAGAAVGLTGVVTAGPATAALGFELKSGLRVDAMTVATSSGGLYSPSAAHAWTRTIPSACNRDRP